MCHNCPRPQEAQRTYDRGAVAPGVPGTGARGRGVSDGPAMASQLTRYLTAAPPPETRVQRWRRLREGRPNTPPAPGTASEIGAERGR